MAKKEKNIETYEDVDRQLQLLSKSESFIAKKEAEMNSKIQDVKKRFEEETAEARAQKTMLQSEIEAFCLMNKADFLKQRTVKLIHGSIGFRTNPPKVTLLNRKYNLATAIELLKRVFTGKYLRTKEEIDKETILADYASKQLDDQKLAGVGLKVDQEETFFTEIDWQSIESELKQVV